jgi:OmcA/MtrC family decaheme c-type cytochrome
MGATAATDPNPLELGRLVHRIHRGKNLPTLYQSSSSAVPAPALDAGNDLPAPFAPENATTPLVGRKYSVVGFRSHEVVYGRVLQRIENAQAPKTLATGVVFPRDLRGCGACHDGAPDRSQTVDAISRRTCSGCHPDVWFGATPATTDGAHVAHAGGPQLADGACRRCHVDPPSLPGDKLYAPISGPSSAHVVPAESPHHSRPTIEIVGVTGMRPGQTPAVHFRVKDRAGPLGPELDAPVPEYEPDAATTASRVPRALGPPSGTFSIQIAGPTIPDYAAGVATWDPIVSGTAAGNPDPYLLTTVTGSSEWAEYVYTFTSTIPAAASGTWAVAIEGRRRKKLGHYDKATYTFVWPYTGESVTESPDNPIVYVDTATGSWTADAVGAPRRRVVSEEKCLRCHGRFELHGGQRHQVEYCLVCHNPNATDWSRRPKQASGAVDLAKTWDGLEERSIHFKVMVHRIHTGGREGAASLASLEPHVIYGYGGPLFFDEGLFPNDLRNCTLCHEGKSYLVEAVPEGAPGTIANETPTIRHSAAGTHASGEPRTPPVQAACTGCHATGATLEHVAAKTSGGVETCANCHAKGALSVEVAHGLALPSGGAGSTFSSIAQAVLVPRCATAACHGGSPPLYAPQLDADAAYAAMVGVSSPTVGMPIVAPGAPENSYLLYKLRGDFASAGGSGAPMPPDGLLEAADIAAIEAWIANGAQND